MIEFLLPSDSGVYVCDISGFTMNSITLIVAEGESTGSQQGQ